MPKVKSIQVWGFESHVESQANLAPGLTVITGPSDSGKTALLRAIRWVATGEPSGEEFLHTKRTLAGEIISQAEEVGVKIIMDDGREVTKTRRKGKTKYWVTGYSEPFEKAEVPEAVKDLLGIRPTVYGRDAQGKPELEFDLNFSYQLDPPFLISQPASAGAKVLGKLAGTEAIDQALKSTAKDTYAARQDKQQADKEYERKCMQLLDYTDLDDLKTQLDACEWNLEKIEAAVARKDGILELQLQLDQALAKIATAAETLDRLAILPALDEDLKQIEKAQQRYDTLLDLYGRLGKATGQVETLTQQIKGYASLEAAAWLLSEVEAAADRRSKIENLSKEYHRHTEVVNAAKATLDATKDLDLAAKHIAQAEAKRQQAELIRAVLVDYRFALSSRDRLQQNLAYLDQLPAAAELLEQITERQERRQQLGAAMLEYEVKASAQERAQRALDVANDDIRRSELQLAAAWEEAGGMCPLCEQPVSTHNH